ncbi:hypothetical protein KIPB_011253, partial [Kipferlia bialata]|eukprot:g11253.t1
MALDPSSLAVLLILALLGITIDIRPDFEPATAVLVETDNYYPANVPIDSLCFTLTDSFYNDSIEWPYEGVAGYLTQTGVRINPETDDTLDMRFPFSWVDSDKAYCAENVRLFPTMDGYNSIEQEVEIFLELPSWVTADGYTASLQVPVVCNTADTDILGDLYLWAEDSYFMEIPSSASDIHY